MCRARTPDMTSLPISCADGSAEPPTRCCYVHRPLLWHHLPFGSDGFAGDADPRSLDYFGAPSEQAGSRPSERVDTVSVDLCPTPCVGPHLPWQIGIGIRRRQRSASCMAWGANVVAGLAGTAPRLGPHGAAPSDLAAKHDELLRLFAPELRVGGRLASLCCLQASPSE